MANSQSKREIFLLSVLLTALMLFNIQLFFPNSIKTYLEAHLFRELEFKFQLAEEKDALILEENNKQNIYFLGDVMLARHVETIIDKSGINYPFKIFEDIDTEKSFIIGNFEGSIPLRHKKTPNEQLKFSVKSEYPAMLYEIGFTHFSLANNHSLDFGEIGYKNTLFTLFNNNLAVFGDPDSMATSSVTFIKTANSKIAMIGINAVTYKPDLQEMKSVINWTKDNSDLQIVFIHWGEEYKTKSSPSQQKLAHHLADLGIDIIIGHHPHVVQEIEKINDTLVFYSLGNFVFDQYFNKNVQEGLMISFNDEDGYLINLLPINSQSKLSQPRLLKGKEMQSFLEKIARISDPDLKPEIIEGQITLSINLATSSKTVIMTK